MAVNPGGHGTPVHATLQMWVAPDGQQPAELPTVTLQNGLTLFESHLSLWGGEIERMGAGRWTYVRYHSDQPQRCEIDEQRLKREFGDLYGGKQRLLIPKETSDSWFASPARATAQPPASAAGATAQPPASAAGATAQPRASAAGATAQPPASAAGDAEPPGSPPGDAVAPAETPLAGLVADLAQLAHLRDVGSLTDTEFAAAKVRLLGQSPPG
jgi:hypothetical protein